MKRNKRGLFDNIGNIINQGINTINNNNNSNSSINLNGIISNLGNLSNITQDIGQQIGNIGNIGQNIGQDIISLINQLQNSSVLNQTTGLNGLDPAWTNLLISLMQQNPNLVSQLESLLNGGSSSSMSLDQLIQQVSGLLGDMDLSSLGDLIPNIESLINQTGIDQTPLDDFKMLINALESMGLNGTDVHSLLDFFSMFMNDTQMLQAFIDSLPQTYGEFKYIGLFLS